MVSLLDQIECIHLEVQSHVVPALLTISRRHRRFLTPSTRYFFWAAHPDAPVYAPVNSQSLESAWINDLGDMAVKTGAVIGLPGMQSADRHLTRVSGMVGRVPNPGAIRVSYAGGGNFRTALFLKCVVRKAYAVKEMH
jgi:hypothetical protein